MLPSTISRSAKVLKDGLGCQANALIDRVADLADRGHDDRHFSVIPVSNHVALGALEARRSTRCRAGFDSIRYDRVATGPRSISNVGVRGRHLMTCEARRARLPVSR